MTNYYKIWKYCQSKSSFSIDKALMWLMYDGNKPHDISQGRWNGMVKHLKREYQL